jgi:hypothetical protein
VFRATGFFAVVVIDDRSLSNAHGPALGDEGRAGW